MRRGCLARFNGRVASASSPIAGWTWRRRCELLTATAASAGSIAPLTARATPTSSRRSPPTQSQQSRSGTATRPPTAGQPRETYGDDQRPAHGSVGRGQPRREELTIRGLQRANLQNPVHVARDRQQALDYLFGRDGQAPRPVPAVVVLDLQLPRVSGLEVLTRIRADQRTRRLPVVILTSSSDERT